MTNKERVLKIYPSATCYKVKVTDKLEHWHVNINGVCYGSQPREKWAWGEAVRIIKQEKITPQTH